MKYATLLLIFLAHPLLGQEPAHYIIGRDVFDGVKLYSIIQDTDNAVWITSDHGLYGYDSRDFQHIVPQNAKSNALFGLTKNSNNTIFCFNLNGEIFKIEDKTLQLYYTVPPQYLGGSLDLEFDVNDNLIISTLHQVLTIDTNGKLLDVKKDRGFSVAKSEQAIYYGADFGSDSTGIVRLKNGNEIKVASFDIKHHLIVNHSKLFFKNGLFFVFNKAKQEFAELANRDINVVNLPFLNKVGFEAYETDNHLWFCDIKGGVYVTEINSWNTKSKYTKWFNDYYISGVTTDTEGNTWLLTFDKGIVLIPNLETKTAFTKRDLKFVTKSHDKIFISTNDSIYSLNNGNLELFFTTENDRLDYFNISKDRETIITNLNIFANKKKKRRVEFTRDSDILEDSIIVALHDGMYSYIPKTETLNRLTHNRTYNVLNDPKDNVTWIASSVGLQRYSNGKVDEITFKGNPILPRTLTAVEDNIWATTDTGIFVINDNSIARHITVNDGLLDSAIKKLTYEHPFVYILFQKGMQQHNIITKSFKDFDHADGLTENVSSFTVLNDTVYAVNSDGLLSFSFQNLKQKNFNYQTKITRALANGNTKINNHSILKPNEHNVEFSFLTTTFKNRQRTSYQYQLLGFDPKPRNLKKNQRYVNYSNLPAGTYTFKVDSFLNSVKNSSTSLDFKIQEYWYRTHLFQILVISILFIALYYIYRTRVNILMQKHDRANLKKRLAQSSLTSLKAQMNPHFLFNAMNGIQSLITKNHKIEAHQYLTQLSDFLRVNLKMSDTSFVSLRDEIKLIEKYLNLEKFRFEDTFSYTINTDKVKNEVLIPSMIVQPFVENAVKHGLLHKKEDRKLTIHFEEHIGCIECQVVDNGIGRKVSEKINLGKHHNSFSTKAIQKRFAILKEYYNIDVGFKYTDLYDKDEPSGTLVTIKIPFKKYADD